MYKGIGPEAGRNISDYEAFGHACDRCLLGTDEEQQTFMELAKSCNSLDEFAREVVDWYYSGNWLREEKPEKIAREEAQKKGMSYIIV